MPASPIRSWVRGVFPALLAALVLPQTSAAAAASTTTTSTAAATIINRHANHTTIPPSLPPPHRRLRGRVHWWDGIDDSDILTQTLEGVDQADEVVVEDTTFYFPGELAPLWESIDGEVLLNGHPFHVKGINWFGFETDTR